MEDGEMVRAEVDGIVGAPLRISEKDLHRLLAQKEYEAKELTDSGKKVLIAMLEEASRNVGKIGDSIRALIDVVR